MSTDSARGGKGGESGDTTTDARLALKAIKERWPMPEGKRQRLINMLYRRALAKGSTERGAIAAAKAIFTAEAQNMEQERRDLAIPEYHSHAVSVVEIVEDTNWYGRTGPQDNLPPTSDAASAGSPAE